MIADTEDLKQFLILAKTAKGAACVALIKQALDHPGVHVFGELLDMPTVQELAGSSHAPYLELLKVFAYGTWSEYKAQAAELPSMTPAQAAKLKKLSAVTFAAQSKMVPYDLLLRELEVPPSALLARPLRIPSPSRPHGSLLAAGRSQQHTSSC